MSLSTSNSMLQRRFGVHRFPAVKACRGRDVVGFTLLEVLVALAAAGLLVAMIASVLGRGTVVSSALEQASEGQRSRGVLHRLLSMDLRNVLPDTEITFTDQGFTLETGHNHLLPGPMPVTVTWFFTDQGLQRDEEQLELGYVRSTVIMPELESWALALYDLSESRWIDLRSWLHAGDRPFPAGMRLDLQAPGHHSWRFVFRLPLQHDAAL
ncbi:prepilin-type N-terminal cleavage/methylation domain-containing protein [Desulfonatronum thiosulfatophilum]|nr:prepilin-type N-terminal cleavage/methylation domain-containing protein [Desulfonatronum thiosulfatophilum]